MNFEQIVLGLVFENDGITNPEIAEMLGWSKDRVRKCIARLVDNKLIKESGLKRVSKHSFAKMYTTTEEWEKPAPDNKLVEKALKNRLDIEIVWPQLVECNAMC